MVGRIRFVAGERLNMLGFRIDAKEYVNATAHINVIALRDIDAAGPSFEVVRDAGYVALHFSVLNHRLPHAFR